MARPAHAAGTVVVRTPGVDKTDVGAAVSGEAAVALVDGVDILAEPAVFGRVVQFDQRKMNVIDIRERPGSSGYLEGQPPPYDNCGYPCWSTVEHI